MSKSIGLICRIKGLYFVFYNSWHCQNISGLFTRRKSNLISSITYQIRLDRCRLNLYGHFFTSTVPHLEFSIQFQSNSLIYDKGYSIRQHMIYSLIQLMKEEGLGYRRISKKLNQWGIKTHRGCEWFNTSVSSVLKRKHERDDLVNNIRNKHYPSKISKMKLKYYTFDWTAFNI